MRPISKHVSCRRYGNDDRGGSEIGGSGVEGRIGETVKKRYSSDRRGEAQAREGGGEIIK